MFSLDQHRGERFAKYIPICETPADAIWFHHNSIGANYRPAQRRQRLKAEVGSWDQAAGGVPAVMQTGCCREEAWGAGSMTARDS